MHQAAFGYPLPRFRMWVCAFVLTLPMEAAMAEQATPVATPPTACADPAFHAFDFWLGDWEVYNGDKLIGHNSIRAIEQGCGLSESWRSASGITGVSYNAYDPADQHWHQFWVSAAGYVLRLRGNADADGSMVMRGQLPNPKTGKMDQQRITWSRQPDGSVRQLWEASADGLEWSVSFDGNYRRVSSEQSRQPAD
jgi:hypothetical protein